MLDDFYRRITPDYANAIIIATGFTPIVSGIVNITGFASIGFLVRVNNIEVARGGGQSGQATTQDSTYVPVLPGDVVTFTYNTSYGGYSFRFFPYRL